MQVTTLKTLAVILASTIIAVALDKLTDYWQLSYYPKHAIIVLGLTTPYMFFNIQKR